MADNNNGVNANMNQIPYPVEYYLARDGYEPHFEPGVCQSEIYAGRNNRANNLIPRCNGEVRNFAFDWHVRPRGHPEDAYWSLLVVPLCVCHINYIVFEHAGDQGNTKITTAGRDEFDAMDIFCLDW